MPLISRMFVVLAVWLLISGLQGYASPDSHWTYSDRSFETPEQQPVENPTPSDPPLPEVVPEPRPTYGYTPSRPGPPTPDLPPTPDIPEPTKPGLITNSEAVFSSKLIETSIFLCMIIAGISLISTSLQSRANQHKH